MARIDEEPEDRDQEPLRLEQLVECVMCGGLVEALFVAPEGVFDLDELITAPTADQKCEHCGFEWVATYSGWHINEEA